MPGVAEAFLKVAQELIATRGGTTHDTANNIASHNHTGAQSASTSPARPATINPSLPSNPEAESKCC